MATITLEYDARNKVFEKLIDVLIALGAKKKRNPQKGKNVPLTNILKI